MATPTYLAAPIKVEKNQRSREPDQIFWASCSIALSILSYYAPKIFLAASVSIFVYQVDSFNQLVHTADNSKRQHIHEWAINACLVMWSVGTAFGIKSLPCFWSAVTDLRHLHLIHSVSHLAKGAIMMLVAVGLAQFLNSAKDLASRRRWVEMEDYVINYPAEIKQEILSSYSKQLTFYITALLPQTWLAAQLSKKNFSLSQFQPEDRKASILKDFFKSWVSLHTPLMKNWQWPLAIHQFQQLSKAMHTTFSKQLSSLLKNISDAERAALPVDVHVPFLLETLSSFERIPSDQEANYNQWRAFVAAFKRLPREHQSFLGTRLYLLSIKSPSAISLEEPITLAALKGCAMLSTKSKAPLFTAGDTLFNNLTDPFKDEFGLFLQKLIDNGTLKKDQLSLQMQDALP